MHKYPYLDDAKFLRDIDDLKLKEQYIKINILDFKEKFIQSIQGKVTAGNINLDGSSGMRRSCNLTMVAEAIENDLNNVENLLSINKKIEIEIGFLNTTDRYLNYPILWFPQGIYVIVAPSITRSVSSATISLQLKDKMALLNGECGGTFPASVTFHEMDTFDNEGNIVTVKPTIYQIIQELVHHWGGEQLGKIIINDVDNQVKYVAKWMGKTPLYKIAIKEKDSVNNNKEYVFSTKADGYDQDRYTSVGSEQYTYNTDIGFIYKDFVYPGELIGDAGTTITSILDKIKNTLGNYEYFYDVEGNFVFQEIKNYFNTSHATTVLNELNSGTYLVDYHKNKTVYNFSNSNIITSFSNNPQYNMIKNDYVVWGMRKDVEGKSIPIRYHLAIDSKPKIGNSYSIILYEDPDDKILKAKTPVKVAKYELLPRPGIFNILYYVEEEEKIYRWNGKVKDYELISLELEDITTKDWRTELFLSGSSAEKLAIDSNYYYTELQNEWTKIYDVVNGEFYPDLDITQMDYFLDFIDSDTQLSQLSISNIGRRTKTINDETINCLFEPEIPDLVLINRDEDETIVELQRNTCINKGQNFSQIPGSIYNMLNIGGNYNSAYVMIRSLLNQYTQYNESINLQTIPIYYLEPKSRISVRDNKTGIRGDYIINTISLPLTLSGTMTITATRIVERI